MRDPSSPVVPQRSAADEVSFVGKFSENSACGNLSDDEEDAGNVAGSGSWPWSTIAVGVCRCWLSSPRAPPEWIVEPFNNKYSDNKYSQV